MRSPHPNARDPKVATPLSLGYSMGWQNKEILRKWNKNKNETRSPERQTGSVCVGHVFRRVWHADYEPSAWVGKPLCIRPPWQSVINRSPPPHTHSMDYKRYRPVRCW